jgi:hypothetical protein
MILSFLFDMETSKIALILELAHRINTPSKM